MSSCANTAACRISSIPGYRGEWKDIAARRARMRRERKNDYRATSGDYPWVSARMMYDLAAPNGPIPCTRYSPKCIRFNEQDVESYRKECQHTLMRETIVGASRSIKLSTDSESASQSYFRKRGIAVKPKRSISPKPPGSTELQLVRSSIDISSETR